MESMRNLYTRRYYYKEMFTALKNGLAIIADYINTMGEIIRW